jgi:hypothetical protein
MRALWSVDLSHNRIAVWPEAFGSALPPPAPSTTEIATPPSTPSAASITAALVAAAGSPLVMQPHRHVHRSDASETSTPATRHHHHRHRRHHHHHQHHASLEDSDASARPGGTPRRRHDAHTSTLLPPLAELSLHDNKLYELRSSAADFAHYERLTRLDLSRNALVRLPSELCGTLTALAHLDLSDCAALTEIPANIGTLTQLRTLLLARCAKLSTLPVGIASLPLLTASNLGGWVGCVCSVTLCVSAVSVGLVSAAAPRPLGVGTDDDDDDGGVDTRASKDEDRSDRSDRSDRRRRRRHRVRARRAAADATLRDEFAHVCDVRTDASERNDVTSKDDEEEVCARDLVCMCACVVFAFACNLGGL